MRVEIKPVMKFKYMLVLRSRLLQKWLMSTSQKQMTMRFPLKYFDVEPCDEKHTYLTFCSPVCEVSSKR